MKRAIRIIGEFIVVVLISVVMYAGIRTMSKEDKDKMRKEELFI